MASLKDRIRALIAASGPIPVSDYFALCLADPEHGYYRTRDPFGRAGDFITAPEVSQLFGEMIAVFLVHAWQRHGSPARIRLAEIGPGRGTMMADMLRVIARLAPSMMEGLSIHMVETSPALRKVQAEKLRQNLDRIAWHESLEEIPSGFLLMVGNEFFDAVAMRQFIKTASGFRERMVGLDAGGELTFAAGYAGIDPLCLPPGHEDAPLGAIAEIAPAREAIMQRVAERLLATGGTALFIDYGHLVSGLGDTLQAVRNHAFDQPLSHPGEADLTSHVDFASLAQTARSAAIHVNGMTTQADFLLSLGLLERAGQLGAGKDRAAQQAIEAAVERLAGAGPAGMGDLFKVLAVSSPTVALAPFEDER